MPKVQIFAFCGLSKISIHWKAVGIPYFFVNLDLIFVRSDVVGNRTKNGASVSSDSVTSGDFGVWKERILLNILKPLIEIWRSIESWKKIGK